MELKKILILMIGMGLIISGVVLAMTSIFVSQSVRSEQQQFLDDENMDIEKFSVEMRDGIILQGMMYVNRDFRKLKDHSIPTILFIPGINRRKEDHRFKALNLVKFGYAVFTVEQRGHGESEGLSGFIGKEPEDMIEVIDYIEENYAFAKTSQMGLMALSYGGGIALVLQARDPRIHASVIYHPLSSLEAVLDHIPFENFVGHTRAIEDLNEIQDAFAECTPENTKNLLLLHGWKDRIIDVEDSISLYQQLNGENRDDIDLIIKESLYHAGNAGNRDSLRNAILWFEYFFHGLQLDLSNRYEIADQMTLTNYDWPESPLPELFILIAAIGIFLGLSVILLPLFIWPLYYKHYSDLEKVHASYDLDNVEERYDFARLFGNSAKYKKMILLRSMFYVLPTIVGGLLCAIFNWGILYGYFIMIPVATLIFMAFIPSSEHPLWKYEWKHEWDDWYKNHIIVILISVQTVIIPTILYLFIFNFNAHLMRIPPIPWFNLTALVYFAIPSCLFLMDSMCIRGWKFKHSAGLIVLRPLTLFIFHLFVPIPVFEDFGGIFLFIVFMTTIGLAGWGLINLFDFIARTYKSRATAALIILVPYVISFLHFFFRIV